MTSTVRNAVLVNTVPKSGTYLVAEILAQLGLRPTQLHLFPDRCDDVANPDDVERWDEPLEVSTARVQPGTFAVGHLPCTGRVRDAVARFRVVFVRRELRHCLVSRMRQLTPRLQEAWAREADPRRRLLAYLRTHGAGELHRAKDMPDWLCCPSALAVRFDDFRSRGRAAPETVSAMARFVGIERCDAAGALERALSAGTRTRNDSPTRLSAFWSDAAEAWFRAHGGVRLNAELGF